MSPRRCTAIAIGKRKEWKYDPDRRERRHQDRLVPRRPRTTAWLSHDPMSEKYYSISSYAYCAGNPENIIDPQGDDLLISGANDSSIRLLSEQIDYSLDLSALGFDFGGNISIQNGDEIIGSLLDAIGIFDPTGVADGANAFFQFQIGDNKDGAISIASALLPYNWRYSEV